MTAPVFVITGAGGYLGRRLVSWAVTRGRVIAATHRPTRELGADEQVLLDITDRNGVHDLMRRFEPSAVIHAAAVNPGQGDDSTMWRVNAEGSRFVAGAARFVGARLVAVSTDIVHDGLRAPYGDDVPPSPINPYGRSKAAAEVAIAAADPDAAVVRPSLIYGLDEMDRGTAGFARRIAAGETQVLFADVVRNPVWVETLAEALVRLAQVNYAGTLNVGGREALSREAFGRAMLDYWGVDSDGRIRSGRAADIADSVPLDLRLSVGRAESLLGMTFPGVTQVLGSVGKH